MSLKFEETHEYDSSIYYAAPNESTLEWREMLKDIPIHRAAGICSSGEVGFFGILPLVRKELVLVDHSYRSMTVAMLKYLLIREQGWKEAKKLLTTANAEALSVALKPLKVQLPAQAHKHFDALVKENQVFRSEFDYHNNLDKVRREWKRLPDKVLKKATAKLDRVSFVHGDMSDLIEKGPFGLFYMSNALDHVMYTRSDVREKTGDRYNQRVGMMRLIEQIVKPGGYVVGCAVYRPGYYGDSRKEDIGWEVVKEVKAPVGGEQWTQVVYKTPVAA